MIDSMLRFPVRAFRGVSKTAKDLIRWMLSAEQVLMHPWVLSAQGIVSVADMARYRCDRLYKESYAGLNERTTSEGLREAFSKVGEVVHARVVTDLVT